MRPRRAQAGFSVIEALVGLTVLLGGLAAASTMVIEGSRTNRSRQMAMAVQADARNCLSMIESTLRSAGWDPMLIGFDPLDIDPTPSGPGNYIGVFADLNGDGDIKDPKEVITIRHTGNRIEWKPTWQPSAPFIVLAENITNDADGDGTIEPMFQPDSTTNPTRITIRITAESPFPDPRTGLPVRYTLTSDVILRDRV